MFNELVRTVITLVFSASGIPPLGSINSRHPADVAADIESLSHLDTAAFERVAPALLDVIAHARPYALRIRALDTLCAKAGADAASLLANRLQESLTIVLYPADQPRDSVFIRHLEIRAFLTGTPGDWSVAMRDSEAVRAWLRRLANEPGSAYLDYSMYPLGVDALMDCIQSNDARRTELLQIVAAFGPGSPRAGELLVPLMTSEARESLRQLCRQQRMNRSAIETLAHIGDQEVRSYLVDRMASLPADALPEEREFLERSIQQIDAQSPPSRLIECIRSISGPSDHVRFWALRRAAELGLDHVQLKSAVLAWIDEANDWVKPDIKGAAVMAGILSPSDLPNMAPPTHERLGLCVSTPQRRSTPVTIPDKRTKRPDWCPTQENYTVFNEWFGAQDWDHIGDESEALALMQRKLCELILLSPDVCAEVASTSDSN